MYELIVAVLITMTPVQKGDVTATKQELIRLHVQYLKDRKECEARKASLQNTIRKEILELDNSKIQNVEGKSFCREMHRKI